MWSVKNRGGDKKRKDRGVKIRRGNDRAEDKRGKDRGEIRMGKDRAGDKKNGRRMDRDERSEVKGLRSGSESKRSEDEKEKGRRYI